MAGIMYDTEHPGFEHIILQPTPDQSIQYVDCSYDSAYGEIVSNWNYEGNNWSYEATIPANTTATIYIPVEDGKDLFVNGKAPEEVTIETDGLQYTGMKDGKAVFEAVAAYNFSTQVTVYCNITLSQSDSSVAALVSIDGGDFQKIPPSLRVEQGKSITIQAVPQNDVDYTVTGWTGDQTAEDSTITVTPTKDMTLTAQVEWIGHDNLALNQPVSSNAGWETRRLVQ